MARQRLHYLGGLMETQALPVAGGDGCRSRWSLRQARQCQPPNGVEAGWVPGWPERLEVGSGGQPVG